MLNGCAINNRYWVFAAGLTNVHVDLTVTDTQTGQIKTYINPQGRTYVTILDTNAFATCPYDLEPASDRDGAVRRVRAAPLLPSSRPPPLPVAVSSTVLWRPSLPPHRPCVRAPRRAGREDFGRLPPAGLSAGGSRPHEPHRARGPARPRGLRPGDRRVRPPPLLRHDRRRVHAHPRPRAPALDRGAHGGRGAALRPRAHPRPAHPRRDLRAVPPGPLSRHQALLGRGGRGAPPLPRPDAPGRRRAPARSRW